MHKPSGLPEELAKLDRTLVMGVLNVTPDSFSDGGKFNSAQIAIDYARQMVDDGADIVDIGGESTKPGAQRISVEQELDRVIGAVLQYSDSSFNPLLELGFASAIRREWAWRVSRGESLGNLSAFEHLI